MNHHPVFEQFSCYTGPIEAGFVLDSFLGTRHRNEIMQLPGQEREAPATASVSVEYPSLDEEYFEWIDLLEAVTVANDQFVFVELGAGFGRWSIRAINAARSLKKDVHIVAVEAEPNHFQWLGMTLKDNGADPACHTLVNAAICDSDEPVWFYIGMAGKNPPDAANQWYGQAIGWNVPKDEIAPPKEPTGWIMTHGSRLRGLLGRTPIDRGPDYSAVDRSAGSRRMLSDGTELLRVPSVRLEDLLPFDRVDLVDMDLQGAELAVITSTIDLLTARVARLHIGTHSLEIEEQLRQLMPSYGWRSTQDYHLGSEAVTPYGLVTFGDGIQTWVNTGLETQKVGH